MYVLLPAGRDEAWCIDPSYVARSILEACRKMTRRLTWILLTHTQTLSRRRVEEVLAEFPRPGVGPSGRKRRVTVDYLLIDTIPVPRQDLAGVFRTWATSPRWRPASTPPATSPGSSRRSRRDRRGSSSCYCGVRTWQTTSTFLPPRTFAKIWVVCLFWTSGGTSITSALSPGIETFVTRSRVEPSVNSRRTRSALPPPDIVIRTLCWIVIDPLGLP